MKDETKEILNKLLEYFKESNISDFGYEKDKLISYEEAQILLDCITNLQEENERLKEENKRIFSKVNDDELLISNAMNYAEAQKYKLRCEKAVDEIQQLIDDVNNETIIGLNNFLPKLEEIQDKLANGGDE